MYSYEDRIRAVKLYLKLGKRIAATLRQLGYPTKNSLLSWYREYQEHGNLESASVCRKSKYSTEQKKVAVEHYLNHDRCIAVTIRALGYPCRDTLGDWIDELHPEKRVRLVGRAPGVPRSETQKQAAVIELCTRQGSAQAVAENNQRYKDNQQLYRQRQEINEHIFGTIKRLWGFNHTNLRGLEKVNGEHSLIMTVYNLKRSMNILGIENMIEKIKNWKPNYKAIVWLFIKWQKSTLFKAIQAPKIFEYKIAS